MKHVKALLGGITLTALFLVPGTALAAPAATPLPCKATMSTAHPKDNTTVKVTVTTAARAAVTTTAHYKTTATTHKATAPASGKAVITYKISRATPGYTVKVTVSTALGSRRGSCSTSFTPVR